ncbi:hypothetical protein BDV27DRAFT_132343 [Aspergillus caelatus]|uniref:Uncharacterized protein n=1 Tax=Aspergillus caelatus TaxID=61420 RepID=A0A5N6ZWY1_9EURO|nr:uncharacterized protein BDV27DRAFT_132343 [Aspergillus caelatus]KAE8361905.1 hypothetical protein BDV27DRAFT_132343 [Aspergillus caelatus]
MTHTSLSIVLIYRTHRYRLNSFAFICVFSPFFSASFAIYMIQSMGGNKGPEQQRGLCKDA